MVCNKTPNIKLEYSSVSTQGSQAKPPAKMPTVYAARIVSKLSSKHAVTQYSSKCSAKKFATSPQKCPVSYNQLHQRTDLVSDLK
jgi:hypothetical protein